MRLQNDHWIGAADESWQSPVFTGSFTAGALQTAVMEICGLGWDTPAAEVVSSLPLKGNATLRMKKGGLLSLRIPRRIEEGSWRVTVNEKPRETVEAQGYAFIGRVKPGDVVEAAFLPRWETQAELVCHKRYEVTWFGEQAVKVEPGEGFRPLFGDFPAASPANDGSHTN